METGAADPTPDLDDLLQEEPEGLAVPVRPVGSVLVHQLPARRVQYATDMVPAGVWTQLLPETPKRARATLISDEPFRVSSTGTGGGMMWPADVPYELRHTQKVYAISAADESAPAMIGHASELWAD